ncbi:acetolactate synthase 2 small subunit [Zophobihabitans entericus]|uniref:Acetolactate synthase 2 small subunit n=1 Tax=Zophobihabitans entericus TaxID=1635327 RepID=A0A6G9ICF3_9GAMM|nr:acetolactate synthase 2 small subunit [Zophobihabitans entericus]QIQ21911.1 acetolactate synthase 2 small subunit [Zophobihabitans entericus]
MKTKQYNFMIKAYYRLGVLERMLRVIRHRGGYIHQMQMAESGAETLELSLTLSTERPPELLQAQLNKLVDVITTEIAPK